MVWKHFTIVLFLKKKIGRTGVSLIVIRVLVLTKLTILTQVITSTRLLCAKQFIVIKMMLYALLAVFIDFMQIDKIARESDQHNLLYANDELCRHHYPILN